MESFRFSTPGERWGQPRENKLTCTLNCTSAGRCQGSATELRASPGRRRFCTLFLRKCSDREKPTAPVPTLKLFQSRTLGRERRLSGWRESFSPATLQDMFGTRRDFPNWRRSFLTGPLERKISPTQL